MNKTLEFIAIQVAPNPLLSMIIERPGLSRLWTNQWGPRMRNVDVYPLLLLIQEHLVYLPALPQTQGQSSQIQIRIHEVIYSLVNPNLIISIQVAVEPFLFLD